MKDMLTAGTTRPYIMQLVGWSPLFDIFPYSTSAHEGKNKCTQETAFSQEADQSCHDPTAMTCDRLGISWSFSGATSPKEDSLPE